MQKVNKSKNRNAKPWIVGLPLAAAAAFVTLSQAQPAHASAPRGGMGEVVAMQNAGLQAGAGDDDDLNWTDQLRDLARQMVDDAKRDTIPSSEMSATGDSVQRAAKHIYN